MYAMSTSKKQIALLIFSILFILNGTLISSCSKGDGNQEPTYACLTCASSPDALAINDTSIKGIYKGIILGSTGTISINIQNGNNTITATLVLDGVSVALTSNVSLVDGQPFIAPFTGTLNGNPISITFSVGLSGSTPTMVSSSIPGHPNAIFILQKETSTSLIEAFEGTYKEDNKTGIFNVIIARSPSKWGYAEKNDQTGESSTGEGILNSSGQLLDENNRIVATISGDIIHGSSIGSNGKTLVVDGKRTLWKFKYQST